MASHAFIILNAWRGGKEPSEAILLIKVAGWHWQQVSVWSAISNLSLSLSLSLSLCVYVSEVWMFVCIN